MNRSSHARKPGPYTAAKNITRHVTQVTSGNRIIGKETLWYGILRFGGERRPGPPGL
ncbi:hypothetical protein FoTM2_013693 [Fusarium oxysporum f. sp. vasinfectum]|nr:hypothetical protein FoTM2_013693 [Fusarium oxysporum f. sp. vasinfectum]